MPDPNVGVNEDWPEDHRSGVVAVVGRPNVGKSTLINRILGQKIAIVTNKPQTTRSRQLGIYTTEQGQILLIDTPGLHRSHNKLGNFMIYVAEEAIKDADIVLWVLDSSERPSTADLHISKTLNTLLGGKTPVVLALNKSDLRDESTHPEEHLNLIEHIQAQLVSGLTGDGTLELMSYLLTQLPEGPRYYLQDEISDVNMRFIAAEIIREKIIQNTEQEIPYSVAIEITDYKERNNNMTYVSATIFVERDSQKGIILGKKGSMIKQIGSQTRETLTEVIGTRVYLDLFVKVLKNWRNNETMLRRLGYRLPKANKN